ncbi:hypothetical protein PJI17_04390 [Mycobacterium kansasii]
MNTRRHTGLGLAVAAQSKPPLHTRPGKGPGRLVYGAPPSPRRRVLEHVPIPLLA